MCAKTRPQRTAFSCGKSEKTVATTTRDSWHTLRQMACQPGH